jgi:thiamine biosynthesis lipoprotein
MGVGVREEVFAEAMEHAHRLADTWENRFSRFRPESLLCRLNAANGQAVAADDTFRALLERAAVAVRWTGGRFDPAILPVLEALGYDRTLSEVQATPPEGRLTAIPACRSRSEDWARVSIDHEAGLVTLPAGMRIDFGGIAKGAFVDLLAAEFAHWPGGCIDAGGDAVVWGDAPDNRAWHIGVENPHAPDNDALVFDVPAGSRVGVATSGTHRRRWKAGGDEVHHLIDPRTGNPVQGDLCSVTALAESATTAEVAAKAILIAATTPPITELFGASAAVLVTAHGHVELLQKTRGTDHDIDDHPETGRAA